MIYFGTEVISATPLSAHAYEKYMGNGVDVRSPDEDEPGYLVEYLGTGRSNHPGHDNYVSWSPAEVFDNTYETSGSLSFGHAVRALKMGNKVARIGWNGKGMFLYYVPAAKYPAQRNTKQTLVGMFPKDMVPYRDYIAMKTAQNDVVPWVASQSDVLADDWYIVE